MENKEIEDEEMLVNETSEECDLDLEAKAKQIKERAFKAGYCFLDTALIKYSAFLGFILIVLL